jgi:hypothetical protein
MAANINVDLLVTDWGHWPCPEDLKALWKAAPKIYIPGYCEEDNGRWVPDGKSKIGKLYYKRERELLAAIAVIEQSGTMMVQAIPSQEERDRTKINAYLAARSN